MALEIRGYRIPVLFISSFLHERRMKIVPGRGRGGYRSGGGMQRKLRTFPVIREAYASHI